MAVHGLTGTRLDPALSAYQRTSDSISASQFRLGSGVRFQHTGDDTASVTSATALQTQNSTLRSSLQNGAHATTLLQIADNSLSQIRAILEGLVDLTQTANGSGITHAQYTLLDGQFQQQKNAIDGIVSASVYQGANLLDGTFNGAGAAPYQLGDVSSGTIPITIPSVTATSLFTAPVSLGNAASAAAATAPVSAAQQMVEDAIAKVAAYQSRLDSAEAATRSAIQGVQNGTDGLLATDTNVEANNLASATLKQHAAAALMAQALGINTTLLSLIH